MAALNLTDNDPYTKNNFTLQPGTHMCTWLKEHSEV